MFVNHSSPKIRSFCLITTKDKRILLRCLFFYFILIQVIGTRTVDQQLQYDSSRNYLCFCSFLTYIYVKQVPKGWDKLYVSLVSAKKGKTISKSGKASVRNGSCRWTETLSDSIWVARDNDSKDLEQCLFKLVVSMVWYLCRQIKFLS